MSRYHVNNETGVSGICHAIKRCPFGLPIDEHYPSEYAAREAYEVKMKGFEINSYQKFTIEAFRKIPSEILKKTDLKDLNAAQLSQTLQSESHDADLDKEIIGSAVDLASILHSKQTRGNRGNFITTPYIEHPLRNSLRLLRLGVRDQDVIVASILHDTIEDGAKMFVEKFNGSNAVTGEIAARAELGEYINKAYGNRVLKLVEAVTNDYIADTDKTRMSVKEKNRIYKEHVENNIKGNAGIVLVKISDICDNATGLYHNDIPGREAKTKKQAVKYLPVIDVFLKELDRTDLGLPEASIAHLKDKMHRTIIRLEAIISRHKNI